MEAHVSQSALGVQFHLHRLPEMPRRSGNATRPIAGRGTRALRTIRRRFEETLAFLQAGGSSLHPIERANLGDLRTWCGTAIHLQCASGRDTLSLWNEGVAQVIGVDIADVHIANAQRLSAALGAPATWYRCDVLETPSALDGWRIWCIRGKARCAGCTILMPGRPSCGGS